MAMNDKSEFINRIYLLARAKGLCHTQGEFATLLGMNDSTISGAMNGAERNLTENLIRRVTSWAKQMGLMDGDINAVPPQRDITIPAATAKFYENLTESVKTMSETIKLQQELIARLTPPKE